MIFRPCLQFCSINSKLCLSSKSDLTFVGVPQGSVIGPLLVTPYTTSLSSLTSGRSIPHHLYADDSQWFLACTVDLLEYNMSIEDPEDVNYSQDILYRSLSNCNYGRQQRHISWCLVFTRRHTLRHGQQWYLFQGNQQASSGKCYFALLFADFWGDSVLKPRIS